jgi:hypothetical protein
MNSLRSAVCSLIILVLLVGCAPQPFGPMEMVNTQVSTTFYIAKGAVEGLSGTKIMASPDGDMFVLVRNIGEYWGFVVTSSSGGSVGSVLNEIGGRMATCTAMRCLEDVLIQKGGWKVITAAELPVQFRLALGAANMAQVGVNSLTTILVLPAGLMQAPEYIDVKGPEL